MEFHPLLVKIIDTPQFQRLRYIKQLGGAYLVYPGASHNRFEHSLGVAHLAGKLVRSLQEKQSELEIDDKDILCVEIAGLCHDLGHGPFSHLSDGMFRPKAKPGSDWKHEEASVWMFRYIKKKIQNVFPKDFKDDDYVFIEEMINGPEKKGCYKGRPSSKSFLYEIVSNKRNGLDVDKFDYFARDCYHLGLKNSFDHNRYIKFARVIEVENELQICTRDKEVSNIYEMFHTRSSLHRKAYQHKTTKIIEAMIKDALLKANIDIETDDMKKDKEEMKKYEECIEKYKEEYKEEYMEKYKQEKEEEYTEYMNKYEEYMKKYMEEYTYLTDDIFEQILFSTENTLKEAREILLNVVSRQLYPCLGTTKLTDGLAKEAAGKKIEEWKSELAKMQCNSYQEETPLEETDFEILISTFDFGKKEENPLDYVYFYDKFDEEKAFKISRNKVSQFLLPNKFSEEWISVYCKNSDKKRLAQIHFNEWCRTKKLSLPLNPTQQQTDNQQPKRPKGKQQSNRRFYGLTVFNDPIHGSMEFHPFLVKIIDTPPFQTLRFIKKLDEAYFVYPGASHNQFEHSLGDCYHLGLKINFDYERIIKFAKVHEVDGKKQICFRDKVANTILDLFHTFAGLQKKVYQHKVTKRIHRMQVFH
ncbi:hypothetical protein WMY93_015064 [Mugilogobius chulae]|uniref:HD/PDEase domain-containing protein n=1 Tax=Mugilogobius chulae TaxID=88201 RepID=A0AAW0P0I2_9GOBI